jgi:Uma2 family endonuclease
MSAAPKLNLVSLEDYFAAEERSEIRHEYVAGQVYAMPGGTSFHAMISTNIAGALYSALKGTPCRAFGADLKVKAEYRDEKYVYYPDVSVFCDLGPLQQHYQERPVVVVEVLSPSTRRVDRREKLDVYRAIPSLRVYLLVEQTPASVMVYRRTDDGFVVEQYNQLTDIIPLPEIGTQLALADVYDGISESD